MHFHDEMNASGQVGEQKKKMGVYEMQTLSAENGKSL